MSDTTLLRENNPTVADFVDRWRSKYQRSYDLTKPAEQACLYEAVTEMARHVASGSFTAALNVGVDNNGVTSLHLGSAPKS